MAQRGRRAPPRFYAVKHERARCIDYRRLIGAFVRKPQAVRYSQLREDLLPDATYGAIWQHVDRHLEARGVQTHRRHPCAGHPGRLRAGLGGLSARTHCRGATGAAR